MPNCIVMGSQWGDEGKGKLVDILAAKAHCVVRFQGGANAGHTIVEGGKEGRKFVLHLVPSGILAGNCVNVIGSGCVVDLKRLATEIEYLRTAGIPVGPDNLLVSSSAHIVTPVHRRLDQLEGGKIGTTGRGIGPCYADKARRVGIRMDSLLDGSFLSRYAALADEYAKGPASSPENTFRPEEELASLEKHAQAVRPYVGDAAATIAASADAMQRILYEGAQGTLLDIDHGTYPFVTSSSTTIGGAYSGSGIYLEFDWRVAVVKAYSTRVGNGPFPTELDNETGLELRKRGNEYGATTGRPRRCGWLDLHLLRKSFRINGFNYIALTKLDCLRGFETLNVAVGRDDAGTPVYRQLEGFGSDLASCKSFDSLPSAARAYVRFIEDELEQPVGMVSTGPGRDETIVRRAVW